MTEAKHGLVHRILTNLPAISDVLHGGLHACGGQAKGSEEEACLKLVKFCRK